MIFGKSIGLQGRALKNRVIEEVLAIEARDGGLAELIPLLAGPRMKEAWEKGDVDFAPLMVGQSIGLIRDIPTCRELIERMAAEAEVCLERARRMIHAL
jgi:NAD(P)H-dependent flavin oxidoreductase YrpB (nitropropane dioxygenase family)